MVQLIAAISICITGTLSQYAPGVMNRVVINRQAGRTAFNLPAQLPEVDGYIAVLSCKDIGQVWTLNLDGESHRVLVADCAGGVGARRWMIRGGVIGEIDYDFAERHGFVGRGVKAELCRADNQAIMTTGTVTYTAPGELVD